MLFESQCCSAFPWEMTAFKHFLQCNKKKIKEVLFNGKLLNDESTSADMDDTENWLSGCFSGFADKRVFTEIGPSVIFT